MIKVHFNFHTHSFLVQSQCHKLNQSWSSKNLISKAGDSKRTSVNGCSWILLMRQLKSWKWMHLLSTCTGKVNSLYNFSYFNRSLETTISNKQRISFRFSWSHRKGNQGRNDAWNPTCTRSAKFPIWSLGAYL